MKMLPLPLLALACACATEVIHPEKTEQEMQADIKLCTDEANRRFWLDRIAALHSAYGCLEAKGYRRQQPGFRPRVETSLGGGAKPATPAQPCKVPCRPD